MTRRPLTGEPLAVDLLNTRWRQAGDDVDLLATAEGFHQWLAESGLLDTPANQTARDAVCQARTAIGNALAADTSGSRTEATATGVTELDPEAAINAILARGLIVRRWERGTVREHTMMADPDWAAAWRAVSNFVTLKQQAPDGIRQCAHPDCVLHFFDPAGRRRWCSMAGCGNRAKARRHYARSVRAGAAIPATAGPGQAVPATARPGAAARTGTKRAAS